MPHDVQITEDDCWKFWPGGQSQIAEDWEHRFVAVEGGWSSGKSWCGARKLLTLHRYNAFDDDGKPTYVPSCVVAPTYSNAMDYDVPIMQEAMDEMGLSYRWCGPGATLGAGKFSGPGFVIEDFGTRKNPSAIIFRTADAPKRITGWEVGAAWGDEAARWKEDRIDPSNDPYIQLTGRVRHPKARFIQLIFTYTNEGDCTRIYNEFHSGHASHALYRARTIDNAKMGEFFKVQQELLTPELVEQYLEGGAMNLRGRALYSMFTEAKHVCDDIELTHNLPLQMSLDFNIAPGMHALLGHYDPINDMFTTVHEIHEKRLDVRGVVAIFAKFINDRGGWKWRDDLEVYGDATGGTQHWAGTGETCYQILAEGLDAAGIPFRIRVPGSNPRVTDRINAVNAALEDARGNVHWKIHRRCERLREDLQRMRYDQFGIPDKDEEKLSHASEADGYRIYRLRPIRKLSDGTGGRMSVVAR